LHENHWRVRAQVCHRGNVLCARRVVREHVLCCVLGPRCHFIRQRILARFQGRDIPCQELIVYERRLRNHRGVCHDAKLGADIIRRQRNHFRKEAGAVVIRFVRVRVPWLKWAFL
jgi:hypothetical protein